MHSKHFVIVLENLSVSSILVPPLQLNCHLMYSCLIISVLANSLNYT